MTLYILNGELTPNILAEELAQPDCFTSIFGYVNWPSYVQQISAGSYPASGSFDLNLPPASNPYTYAMVAPLSEGSPTATLTINPIWGTYTSITTSTIEATSTTSSSTTLTFLSTLPSVTVLEVPFAPFTQIYAGLIIGTLAALVILYLLHRSKGGRTDAQVMSDEGIGIG